MNEQRDDDRPDDRLTAALAQAEPVPAFPKERIRSRVRRTLETRRGGAAPWRLLAAAAAAILVFALGVEYGRRLAAPAPGQILIGGASGSPPQSEPGGGEIAQSVSLAIQAQGTQYVAELARLTETAASLSDEEREQARQVAIAVLYGAALELVRAAPEDRLATTLAQALRSRRTDEDGSLIWF